MKLWNWITITVTTLTAASASTISRSRKAARWFAYWPPISTRMPAGAGFAASTTFTSRITLPSARPETSDVIAICCCWFSRFSSAPRLGGGHGREGREWDCAPSGAADHGERTRRRGS